MPRKGITGTGGDNTTINKNLLTTNLGSEGIQIEDVDAEVKKANKKIATLAKTASQINAVQRNLTSVLDRMELEQSRVSSLVYLGFVLLVVTVASIVFDFFYFKTTIEQTISTQDSSRDLNINLVLQDSDAVNTATSSKFNFAH